MIGVGVFIFLAISVELSFAQFYNNRPYPTYSLENMPDTGFSCRDKILGGYYADSETQCQMFHVCVKVSGVGIQDFRFLCPNGTAFDQDHQICADWDDVDCDAATLYYSSDNFDLYRIGSGFESKSVKYGEDEESFGLQRAESGDIRLNREQQVQRVNQQKEVKAKPKPKVTTTTTTTTTQAPSYFNNNNKNNNRNYNTEKDNSEKDLFKGSSSSNFFNNRNGGKEVEEEDDDETPANVNVNQDNDFYQRRKINRNQNRRPVEDEDKTERSNRPSAFSNNFAGSSYAPTTARPTTAAANNEQQQQQHNQRTRQRGRGNFQYNNANTFRQTNERGSDGDDGQYRHRESEGQYRDSSNNGRYNSRTTQFVASTPAPFRQTQKANNNNNDFFNKQNTRDEFTSQRNQFNQQSSSAVTSNLPSKPTENYPSHFLQQQKQNENYQSTPQKQVKSFENYPSTPFKQNENFSSQKQSKETENYPTTTSFNFNHNRNTQSQDQFSNYETTKSKVPDFSNNFNSKKVAPLSSSKQTDNYPTTFSPKTTPYKNVYTTTVTPKPSNPQTSQQATQLTSNKFYNQFSQSTNFNQNDNTKSTNTQTTFNNQPSSNKQTTQYNSPTSQKQTTQHTQYTPTVPRITTPSYSSTTQSNVRQRANRYDETQYDDGSYDRRYDSDDKDNKEDEVFKTAHSFNIASSKNEYFQNSKAASTTQKPRPFSVTPNSRGTDFTKSSSRGNDYTSKGTDYTSKGTDYTSKGTDYTKPSPKVTDFSKVSSSKGTDYTRPSSDYTRTTINNNKPSQPAPKPTAKTTNVSSPNKKVKDVSYDYAYYDSSIGSDHEYDIGLEFTKSDKIKDKKQ